MRLLKYIILMFFMMVFLTGCSSKRYYNNFSNDTSKKFIPKRTQAEYYLPVSKLKKMAEKKLSLTFEAIDKDGQMVKNRNSFSKKDRYQFIFSKEI